MDVDEAMRLSRFQRPGVRLVVGPVGAREEVMKPLPNYKLRLLPGDFSWQARALRLRLGYLPSPWARFFAMEAGRWGHLLTAEEFRWLHGRSCSLEEAQSWVLKIISEHRKRSREQAENEKLQ